MKIDATFKDWLALAERRADVIMLDGRKAELVAVFKNTGTCKIKVNGRHLMCDVRQIEYVMLNGYKLDLPLWPLTPGPGTTQPTRNSNRWYRPLPVIPMR